MLRGALCVFFVATGIGLSRVEAAETVLLLKSTTPDGDVIWPSSIEEINAWPVWKLGDEPPLSVGRAIAVAMKDLVAKNEAKLWNVESVHVQRPVQRDVRIDPRREFFFVVQIWKTKSPSSDEQHFEVVVTMGGKLIERKLEPIKATKGSPGPSR